MPFRKLQGWYAYYLKEPFGWQIEELRHGQQCAAAMNASFIAPPQQLFKPMDFYLRPSKEAKPEKKPPSTDDIKRAFNMG